MTDLIEPRGNRLRLGGRSVAVAALVIAGVLAAAWVLSRSTRVLGWLAAAIVVAALLYPIVEALSNRMRRGIAVALVVVATVALIGAVVWAGVGDLQSGLARLRHTAPDVAERAERSTSWIGDAARQFGLRARVEGLLEDLPARLAGGSSAAAVRAAATRGLAILITLVLVVFLISHGPRLVRGVLRQVPEAHRPAVSTALYWAYRRSWAYTVCMLAKAVAVALVVYVLCRVLELPAPSVFAVVIGATSIVPYLGIVLGGLWLVLLAAGVHGGASAVVTAFVLLGLQALDAVVTARVVQERTLRVGPAVSLAALLVGTSLYGLGGGAVALVATIMLVAVAQARLPELEEGPLAASDRDTSPR